jgi:hypothetical protein
MAAGDIDNDGLADLYFSNVGRSCLLATGGSHGSRLSRTNVLEFSLEMT